eukprot:2788788-Rhodomonas_salina.1
MCIRDRPSVPRHFLLERLNQCRRASHDPQRPRSVAGYTGCEFQMWHHAVPLGLGVMNLCVALPYGSVPW